MLEFPGLNLCHILLVLSFNCSTAVSDFFFKLTESSGQRSFVCQLCCHILLFWGAQLHQSTAHKWPVECWNLSDELTQTFAQYNQAKAAAVIGCLMFMSPPTHIYFCPEVCAAVVNLVTEQRKLCVTDSVPQYSHCCLTHFKTKWSWADDARLPLHTLLEWLLEWLLEPKASFFLLRGFLPWIWTVWERPNLLTDTSILVSSPVRSARLPTEYMNLHTWNSYDDYIQDAELANPPQRLSITAHLRQQGMVQMCQSPFPHRNRLQVWNDALEGVGSGKIWVLVLKRFKFLINLQILQVRSHLTYDREAENQTTDPMTVGWLVSS